MPDGSGGMLMLYTIKYGEGSLRVALPDTLSVDVFTPRQAPPLADPLAVFAGALDKPEGCPRLEEMAVPESIAIALPDETRPFPIKLLLPVLLKKIFNVFPQIDHGNIRIVVGGGLHEPPDAAQLRRILPSELHGYAVVSHDAKNSPVRRMGVTSRGTPVEINAAYADADLKIVMGMVDAHQFAGFTGGAKGVVVGCASAAMIAKNHSMLQASGAHAGNIEGNPVREDLNEAGEIAGVTLAVNVALTPEKQIAALFVGNPPRIMRSAALATRRLYGLRLESAYDIVIASCGGAPKDICLYQAQKALDPARRIVAPAGKILLAAECSQGIGDDRYENYVSCFANHETLLRDFARQEFKMGAHKAFLFSRVAASHELVLHTALSDTDVARCLLQKGDAQATLDRWVEKNPAAKVAILTHANSMFFYEEE
uniref:Nickel-dependent lactate racemase n=1 Tax=Desulfovibrio desulfuricans (strain ATCC 27774 / DSM 6949 / MB) TaxID=525146 RepID=B8IYJ9_DESDA